MPTQGYAFRLSPFLVLNLTLSAESPVGCSPLGVPYIIDWGGLEDDLSVFNGHPTGFVYQVPFRYGLPSYS